MDDCGQATMRKVKRIALDAKRADERWLVRAPGVGRAVPRTCPSLNRGQQARARRTV